MQKKPNIKQLKNFVVPKMADIWEDFATQLDITSEQVQTIKRNRPETSVKDHFIEMLHKWLNKDPADDSTKADKLIEATKAIGHHADAQEFEAGWLSL